MAIGVALLFQASLSVTAETVQISGRESQKLAGGAVTGDDGDALANGFVIQNGTLKKYMGVAKKVAIPKGVTAIGEEAFAKQTITEVIIPKGVTDIGEGAFSECEGLKEMVIPEGVTSIGKWAFSYCGSLEKVILPQSLVSIGNEAFLECGNLSGIKIPKNVAKIGRRVFEQCSRESKASNRQHSPAVNWIEFASPKV